MGEVSNGRLVGLCSLCCLTRGQTMVEVMKKMATSFKKSHAHSATLCPQPCSWPLLTHASGRDSWTFTGKSGSVSCGVTAPFSWVLVTQHFIFVSSESLFPQYFVSSGGSMVGLMAITSKRAYAAPRSAAPRAPVPVAGHC